LKIHVSLGDIRTSRRVARHRCDARATVRATLMRLFGSQSQGDGKPTPGAPATWAVEELLALGAPLDVTRGVLAAASDDNQVVMHASVAAWVRLSEIKAAITALGHELDENEALDKLRAIRDVVFDGEKDYECIVDVNASAGFKMYVEQCERVIDNAASAVAQKGKKGKKVAKSLPAKFRAELLPNVKPPASKSKARSNGNFLTRDAFKKIIDALIADFRAPQTSLERVQEDLDTKVYAPARPRLAAEATAARAETPTKSMSPSRIAAPRAQSPAREWGDVGQRVEREDAEDVLLTQAAEDVVSPTRRVFGTMAGVIGSVTSLFRRKSIGTGEVELTQPAQALGDSATPLEDEAFDDDDFAPQQTQYDYDEEDIMPTQVAPREPSPPRPTKRTAAVARMDKDAAPTDSDDEYDTIAIPRVAQAKKKPSGAQRPQVSTPVRPAPIPTMNVAVPSRPSSPVVSGAIKIRRRVHRWTEIEVDALKRGINVYGAGAWALILANNADILHNRTQVDLKDKYRNMQRGGQL
jgi:hypothetical protein